MDRWLRLISLAALTSALACTAGCTTSSDDPPDADEGPAARVTEVIDGDTVEVRFDEDGRSERVRLLGIDAPERTTLRTGRTECGGDQAKAALQRLVAGEPRVRVITDQTQGERDQYGRRLAYLDSVAGSGSLQTQLLGSGWVTTYILRRNPIERAQEFRAYAQAARKDGVGIWKLCGGNFRLPQN